MDEYREVLAWGLLLETCFTSTSAWGHRLPKSRNHYSDREVSDILAYSDIAPSKRIFPACLGSNRFEMKPRKKTQVQILLSVFRRIYHKFWCHPSSPPFYFF